MAAKRLNREEKKAATRARLLASASKVFARRGFSAASVDEIAQEAGFSTGALYSNFSGKDDLFLALFDETIAENLRLYQELFSRGETVEEQVRPGADAHMASLREDPDPFILFVEFWAHAVRNPELRKQLMERLATFRQMFAGMVATGAAQRGFEVRPEMAEQLGTVILALGDGLALFKLADPESVPDELFGFALRMLFDREFPMATLSDSGAPAQAPA